jgi:hypothetical protein
MSGQRGIGCCAYLICNILWDYRYFVYNTRVGILLKECNYLTKNDKSVTVCGYIMSPVEV